MLSNFGGDSFTSYVKPSFSWEEDEFLKLITYINNKIWWSEKLKKNMAIGHQPQIKQPPPKLIIYETIMKLKKNIFIFFMVFTICTYLGKSINLILKRFNFVL